ncbi:NADH-quinone oxidoreductase subunit N [Acrocarpospora catenulata]|uniref:NADH-quinone oxidoreductase subunit N n=1 Tax=Acrocarpospora catenulata TaxID=2836182 RepID=UPI001BD9BCCD|nr:NADH-quinone oxidoreductase subunit N [Acrocarpospora catenulata]
MIQDIDYWAIAAPLILALVAGLVLLLDAFLPRRAQVRTLLGMVTLAGVLAALGVVVAQAVRGDQIGTFCVPGGACSFVVDTYTLLLAGLALAAGAVVVLLSMGELAGGRIPVGEWHFLLLAALTGAVLLPASRDLIMLVVALELVSLPVFALTALRRYDGRASEAALKLFVVSVVSTAIMLFGVSLLYGITGTVHLEHIATALITGTGLTIADGAAVLTVAVVLVVAGFAFKVAAVPFHFWAGDVYEGAPVPVAALLSVVSKAAGFAGLILMLTHGLASETATWAPLVAVIAALTMTAGNVLALRQHHPVRLLAWSSVAQSGYILAPLAAHLDLASALKAATPTDTETMVASLPSPSPGTTDSTGNALVIVKDQAMDLGQVAGSPLAVQASLAYLVFYAAMNILAFSVVMLVSRDRGDLDDYRGLIRRSPVLGLALAFALICLAGLPPGLAGLFAKVAVFREVVFGGLGWLAVVMAVNTVIGLFYYLSWAARLFAPGESRAAERPGRTPVLVAVGAALLVTVAFSAVPQLVFFTIS